MIVTYSSSVWVSLRQSNDTGKLVQELVLLGTSFYSEPVLKDHFLVLKKTRSVSSVYTEVDFYSSVLSENKEQNRTFHHCLICI